MKKILFLTALLLPGLSMAQKKAKEYKVFDLVIGTYTGDGKNDSKGIYVYRFYGETGRTAYLNQTEIKNPSYLTPSADGKFVYAITEDGKNTSSVTAFKFDKNTGKLEKLNSQPSVGSPAYVAVDKENKNLLIANYGGGSFMSFPVGKDGSLGAPNQTIQNAGSGPNKERQEAPHAHAIMYSPDEKFVLGTDLGTDKIHIYDHKASKTPPLTPASTPFIQTAGGSGPRHLAFTPDGKYMYNIQEMSATITGYTFNNGAPKEVQTVKMMPDSFAGENGAADIHISPDGLFLYATNRGTANELVAYAIDPDSGKLTFIARYPTGEHPRNFVIDPNGRFVLVGHKKGVMVFKADKATGRLTRIMSKIDVANAVCLKLVPVE